MMASSYSRSGPGRSPWVAIAIVVGVLVVAGVVAYMLFYNGDTGGAGGGGDAGGGGYFVVPFSVDVIRRFVRRLRNR